MSFFFWRFGWFAASASAVLSCSRLSLVELLLLLIQNWNVLTLHTAYTAVVVRLASRYFLDQVYRLDDWFIIGAACTDAIVTGLGVACKLSFSISKKRCLIMMAVEHHNFGEHVWEIDVKMIPQLLYWCKIMNSVPSLNSSNIASLSLRSVLRFDNRPY